MELINEGRLLSHAMRERIVMTTSEACVIMTKLQDISRQKHVQFEELSRLTRDLYLESEDLQSRMLVASRRRDSSVAKDLLVKVRIKTLGLEMFQRLKSRSVLPMSLLFVSRTCTAI